MSCKLTNLHPWFLLEGEQLVAKRKGLKQRFPQVELIPFARRADNDDVACWAKEVGNEKVCIVHDFSDWGWDRRRVFDTFWEWYRQAVEDMIEHG